VLAADEGVAHADAPRFEVDVAPAQPEELGLAQARDRCRYLDGDAGGEKNA
jgi:hypothetical protein